MTVTVTPQTIAFVKNLEGWTPTAQWDGTQYSYGYGTRAPSAGATITREAAAAALESELQTAASYINHVAPALSVNANQQDSLISAAFNLGSFGSGMITALQSNNPTAIAQRLALYTGAYDPNAAAGVTNRRNAEVAHFNGTESGGPGASATSTAVAGGSPFSASWTPTPYGFGQGGGLGVAEGGSGTTRYAGTAAPQGPYGFENFVNTITSGGSADAIKAAGAAVSAQVSALPLLSQLGALQQINSYIKALPQTAPGAVQFLQNALHTNPELLNDPGLKPLLPAITAAIGTPVNPVAYPNLNPLGGNALAAASFLNPNALNPNQLRGLEGPNYAGPSAGAPGAAAASALVAGGAPLSATSAPSANSYGGWRVGTLQPPASAPQMSPGGLDPAAGPVPLGLPFAPIVPGRTLQNSQQGALPASAYAASPGDLTLQNALNSASAPQTAWNPRTLAQLQQGANQVDALSGTQGSRNAVSALSAASLANGGANISTGAGAGAGGLTSWGALNPNQQRGLAGGSGSDESYRGNSTMWTPGQSATPPTPQVRESWSSAPATWGAPTPTPSPLGNQGGGVASSYNSGGALSAWDRNALTASASAPTPSAWDSGFSATPQQYWQPPSDTSYQGSSATSYTPSAPSSYLDRTALSAPSGLPAPSAWDSGLNASPTQYWTPPAPTAPSYSATSYSADPNAYDSLADATRYNTMLPRSSASAPRANALSAASAGNAGSAGSGYSTSAPASSYQQPSGNLPELTGWSGSSGQGMGSIYGD